MKLKNQHNYKQAIEYLKRAVTAERKNEQPRAEELNAQLSELGRIYDILGKYETSLHYYTRALDAARKYENAEHEVAAQNSVGGTCFYLKRYDEALAAYSQALDVAVKKGYKDRTVEALSNMALTYRMKKDFDSALAHYTQARAAADEAGNPVNIAAITSNIGTLYFFKGDFDEALKNYSNALNIDQKINNNDSLSTDLSNMGGVYIAQGKYGEALNYFEQALKIDRISNNEKKIASRLDRIGEIYFSIGYNDRAVEFLTQSLEINTRINNSVNAAALQNSLGRVYDSMGRYEEAMDHYIKGLSLNKNIELNDTIVSRLADIGMVYESRERYGEAVDYLNRAIRRDIQAEKRERIANNLGNLGRVMISVKKYDQALEYFRQASDINRDLGDSILLADNLKNAGIAHYYRKEYEMAVNQLSKALEAMDDGKEKAREAYCDVRNDVFRWLIDAYIKIEKTDRAYETIERYCEEKRHYGVGDDSITKKMPLQSAENIRNNIEKNSAVVIFANIAWDDPQVIVMDSVISAGYELDKAALVNAVYNVRGKEIEKFMSQKKSDIVFNIQQRSRKDHYLIEFEKIVNYYRSLLGKKYISREEIETMKFLGKSFYNFLFKKIEKVVSDKEVLIIQPDASLSLVPFETLIMTDGRFIAEKFQVRYAVSQTSRETSAKRQYPALRRSLFSIEGLMTAAMPPKKKIESARHFEHILRVAEKKMASGKDVWEAYGYFGIDDFGRSRSDIKELQGAAHDAEVVAGERATEKEILRLSGGGTLANYKIIHFAGSGIVIPEAPLLSAFAVSAQTGEKEKSDGIMNSRELSALNLQADLVSIQDMKINPTGFSRGEGIGDLCSSLLTAGARGVSVSLWPVEDGARLVFMKRVYEQVLKKNIPAGTAIAETKRLFIHGMEDNGTDGRGGPEKYSNPYFWGSWIYYGK